MDIRTYFLRKPQQVNEKQNKPNNEQLDVTGNEEGEEKNSKKLNSDDDDQDFQDPIKHPTRKRNLGTSKDNNKKKKEIKN